MGELSLQLFLSSRRKLMIISCLQIWEWKCLHHCIQMTQTMTPNLTYFLNWMCKPCSTNTSILRRCPCSTHTALLALCYFHFISTILNLSCAEVACHVIVVSVFLLSVQTWAINNNKNIMVHASIYQYDSWCKTAPCTRIVVEGYSI